MLRLTEPGWVPHLTQHSNGCKPLTARRHPLTTICMQAYTAATLGVLAALKAVPAGASALQWLVIGALGFTIYGPQMLIGLCGAELVSPAAVGASQVCFNVRHARCRQHSPGP